MDDSFWKNISYKWYCYKGCVGDTQFNQLITGHKTFTKCFCWKLLSILILLKTKQNKTVSCQKPSELMVLTKAVRSLKIIPCYTSSQITGHRAIVRVLQWVMCPFPQQASSICSEWALGTILTGLSHSELRGHIVGTGCVWNQPYGGVSQGGWYGVGTGSIPVVKKLDYWTDDRVYAERRIYV